MNFLISVLAIEIEVQILTGKVDSEFNLNIYIAQWLARQLATGEVPGSNPGKGENLLISEKKEI